MVAGVRHYDGTPTKQRNEPMTTETCMGYADLDWHSLLTLDHVKRVMDDHCVDCEEMREDFFKGYPSYHNGRDWWLAGDLGEWLGY